jgi:hypothetical protein
MDEVCEFLESGIVAAGLDEPEGLGCSPEHLSAATEALKKLAWLIEEITPSGGEVGVFARALVIAAGHCGQHYWTNAVNRQLANGWL